MCYTYDNGEFVDGVCVATSWEAKNQPREVKLSVVKHRFDCRFGLCAKKHLATFRFHKAESETVDGAFCWTSRPSRLNVARLLKYQNNDAVRAVVKWRKGWFRDSGPEYVPMSSLLDQLVTKERFANTFVLRMHFGKGRIEEQTREASECTAQVNEIWEETLRKLGCGRDMEAKERREEEKLVYYDAKEDFNEEDEKVETLKQEERKEEDRQACQNDDSKQEESDTTGVYDDEHDNEHDEDHGEEHDEERKDQQPLPVQQAAKGSVMVTLGRYLLYGFLGVAALLEVLILLEPFMPPLEEDAEE